jgi:osmoprotectant transport system permease protein
MGRIQIRNWIILVVAVIVFFIVIYNMEWWQSVLHFMFTQETQVIYPRASLFVLTMEHLGLVTVSSILTIIIGVPLGIWVTRRSVLNFLPVVSDLTSIGQTFPPVAVLALAVPVFGFGFVPTIIALWLYGLLPVIRNTITGIQAVPVFIVDAAYGLGMSRMQALFKIEIPIAARIIIAGIRISVIINIGTAMIGAVIGAGGLGSPVIAGLVQDNVAFIIEGVVPAAILAILVDRILAGVEQIFAYPENAG